MRAAQHKTPERTARAHVTTASTEYSTQHAARLLDGPPRYAARLHGGLARHTARLLDAQRARSMRYPRSLDAPPPCAQHAVTSRPRPSQSYSRKLRRPTVHPPSRPPCQACSRQCRIYAQAVPRPTLHPLLLTCVRPLLCTLSAASTHMPFGAASTCTSSCGPWRRRVDAPLVWRHPATSTARRPATLRRRQGVRKVCC